MLILIFFSCYSSIGLISPQTRHSSSPSPSWSPQIVGIKTVLLRGVELYKAEANKPETLSKFGQGTPDDWIEISLITHQIDIRMHADERGHS